MGVKGLLPFVQNASRKCHISEFKGCTVAVDTYCWLHKGAFGCANKIVLGINTDVHIKYCLKYIRFLQSHNIKVILVFDGQHLPAKKETELKRRNQKKHALAQATEYMRLNKTEEAFTYFRQCVDITHQMALALIKECRKIDVDCIVAPYEADAQLAYLNMNNIAELVITEDSDLILFGCSKIMFKFTITDGYGILLEKDLLHQTVGRNSQSYSFDKFRYMCILSGCDYLDSLPGIGLKKAQKAVFMTAELDIPKILPKLPRYLNMPKLVVPDSYIEGFKLADATFQHQIVYDPLKRTLVRLTDPNKSSTSEKYLLNAGNMYDNDRAFQLALGNIDPIHSVVLDDWNPDDVKLSSTSIWSKTYKKRKSAKPFAFTNVIKSPLNKLRSDTASENAIIKENDTRYDERLSEELKVYAIIEPPQKRQKIQSVVNETEELEHPKVHTEIKNPFFKGRNLKTKFRFVRNSESGIKSCYFPNTAENDQSLVEQHEHSLSAHKVISQSNCDNCEVAEQLELETVNNAEKHSDVINRSDNESNEEEHDDESLCSGSIGSFSLTKFQKISVKKMYPKNSIPANFNENGERDDKENEHSDNCTEENMDNGRESPVLSFKSDYYQMHRNRRATIKKQLSPERTEMPNLNASAVVVEDKGDIGVLFENSIKDDDADNKNEFETSNHEETEEVVTILASNNNSCNLGPKTLPSSRNKGGWVKVSGANRLTRIKRQVTLHHFFDKMKSDH